MSQVKDIYNFINEFAPFNTALDFDNVGILVGNPTSFVKKSLIALDITHKVILEAQNINAELIISHHPVIFSPIKNLKSDSLPYHLAQSGINTICAHTNLDIAPKYGVNSCLAKILNLNNATEFNDMGLVATLPYEMTPQELAKYVAIKLSAPGVRFNEINKKINRVAICGGSGGSLVYEAVSLGLDAIITGEIKHHEITFANDNNLTIIDAGHFATENVVINPLMQILSRKFTDIEFSTSITHSDHIKHCIP